MDYEDESIREQKLTVNISIHEWQWYRVWATFDFLNASAVYANVFANEFWKNQPPTDLVCRDLQWAKVTIVSFDNATKNEIVVSRKFEIRNFQNTINGLVVMEDAFSNFFGSFLNRSNCWLNRNQFSNMLDFKPHQVWNS